MQNRRGMAPPVFISADLRSVADAHAATAEIIAPIVVHRAAHDVATAVCRRRPAAPAAAAAPRMPSAAAPTPRPIAAPELMPRPPPRQPRPPPPTKRPPPTRPPPMRPPPTRPPPIRPPPTRRPCVFTIRSDASLDAIGAFDRALPATLRGAAEAALVAKSDAPASIAAPRIQFLPFISAPLFILRDTLRDPNV